MADSLDRRLKWFGVALASTSGLAIVAWAFLSVPMKFMVPFVVLPTAAVLVGAILLSKRRYERLHVFGHKLMRGAAWGFIATLLYDAIRPALTWAFRLDFDAYKAIAIFGTLITGRPEGELIGQLAGWTYHFWNGISFGMMFALMWPRGGAVAGLLWALVLQGFMMVAYPRFLELRLANPGFLATGLVGHGIWGLILGAGLKRGSADA